MVEVVIQRQDQDVAAIPDAACSHIELSVCKGMLPQVKTYPVERLTLRFVHCDGIAQPEWELSSLDHQSTPGQGKPEMMRGRTNCLRSISVSTVTRCRLIYLTMTLVLFISQSWTEMFLVTITGS